MSLAASGPGGLLFLLVCAAWLAGTYWVLRYYLLAAAGLLLVAGVVLLRFVGLSPLLLDCSIVVDAALLVWGSYLYTHNQDIYVTFAFAQ